MDHPPLSFLVHWRLWGVNEGCQRSPERGGPRDRSRATLKAFPLFIFAPLPAWPCVQYVQGSWWRAASLARQRSV